MEEKILAAEEVRSDSGTHVSMKRKNIRRRWTPQNIAALCLALIPLIGFIVFSGFPLIISMI